MPHMPRGGADGAATRGRHAARAAPEPTPAPPTGTRKKVKIATWNLHWHHGISREYTQHCINYLKNK